MFEHAYQALLSTVDGFLQNCLDGPKVLKFFLPIFRQAERSVKAHGSVEHIFQETRTTGWRKRQAQFNEFNVPRSV